MYVLKIVLLICSLLVFFYLPARGSDKERFAEDFEIRDDHIDIRLDIDAGEVDVKAGDSKVLSIRVDYTAGAFDIQTDYDARRARLTIEVDKENWRGEDDNSHARILLDLPRRTRIALLAKIKAGDIDMDFGQLSMEELDLTTWAGEVDVDFATANQTEMKYLMINTKIGDTEIRHLGNARFEEAEIDGGIGELNLEFDGKMVDGALVDIDLDIGETTLDLPEELGVKLSVSEFLFLTDVDLPDDFRKSGRHYYTRNYDKTDRSFELRVSQGIGSVQFR